MNDQENGITLGQLLSVFKKNLIRGIVYVVVCVLVMSAVLIMVKTFSSINVYKSTISFSNVKPNNLSSMNFNKANVVNKALVSDGKSIDLSNSVIRNLTISSIVPADLSDNESFVSSSFTVSLKSSPELKFSSEEYKSLVDNIAKEYVNQFATSSMPEIYNLIDVNSQLESGEEYLQITFYLSNIIDNYLSNLNSFISLNPAAVNFTESESGKNINEIISDFTLIKNAVDNLKSYVALNKFGKGNLNEYLAAAQVFAVSEVAEHQKIYDASIASINAYKSAVESITKDNNGNNIYIFDDTVLTVLSEQAATAAKQLGAASKKQAEIDKFVEIVGTATGTEEPAVVERLNSLGAYLSSTVSKYLSLSKEFNNNKTSISQATETNPAHAESESFITTKILLVADVAVAVVAYIVSLSQTYTKMKKKGLLSQITD